VMPVIQALRSQGGQQPPYTAHANVGKGGLYRENLNSRRILWVTLVDQAVDGWA
jgi:hypothetical protein